MADTKRTEIAELGEFGLIDHLTKDLKPQNASTLYGVGDDCAVLDYSGKDKEGQYIRYLRHERYTPSDDRISSPEQAFLS